MVALSSNASGFARRAKNSFAQTSQVLMAARHGFWGRTHARPARGTGVQAEIDPLWLSSQVLDEQSVAQRPSPRGSTASIGPLGSGRGRANVPDPNRPCGDDAASSDHAAPVGSGLAVVPPQNP